MKLLVVIDCQIDFTSSALANPEAEARVPKIVELINEFREAATGEDCVIFTKDTHAENYMTTLEGQKLPIPHCIVGTEGWELVPELDEILCDMAQKRENVEVYIKRTFGSRDLMNECYRNEAEIESIDICGFVSSICVASNALMLRAACPNVPITVHADCCAGLGKEDHDAAMTVMKCCQIDIVGE